MSRTFAYCRVSMLDQTTDNQVQKIAADGFNFMKARTIVETVSGSVAAKERKRFARLLDKMETGDVLIVTIWLYDACPYRRTGKTRRSRAGRRLTKLKQLS